MTTFEPLSRSLAGRTFALTTHFTQPASCSNTPLTGFLSGFSTYPVPPVFGGDGKDPNCIPSAYSEADYGTYSPGMCPGGYTTWRSATSNGLTSAHCCPTGIGGGWSAFGRFCGKSVLDWPTQVLLFDIQSTKTVNIITTSIKSYFVESVGFHVYHRQEDLTLFPADYTPGVAYQAVSSVSSTSSSATSSYISGTSASSPTPAASTSTTQDSSRPSTNAKTGLGTGTKVGIGIGATIVVILLALLIWFILRQRRNGLKKRKLNPGGPELHGDDIKEAPNTEVSGVPKTIAEPKTEDLDNHSNYGTGRAELADKEVGVATTDHELHGEHREAELEAPAKPYSSRASPAGLLTAWPVELSTHNNQSHLHSEASTYTTQGPADQHFPENRLGNDPLPGKKEDRALVADPMPSPLSERELEIQWLEREEARIRERKEQLKMDISK